MAQLPETTDDSFVREVDEEYRRAQLAGFWRSYGRWLVAAVIILLAALGGWLWWQNEQVRRAGVAGEDFSAALAKVEIGNVPAAAPALARLATGDRPGYAALARLTQAANAVQAGDTPGAVKIYTALAADTAQPQPFRDLATIKATRLEFDVLPPADGDRPPQDAERSRQPMVRGRGRDDRDRAAEGWAARAGGRAVCQHRQGYDAAIGTARPHAAACRFARRDDRPAPGPGRGAVMKIKSLAAPLTLALVLALPLGGCSIFKGKVAKTPTVGERVPVLDFETRVEAEPDLAAVAVRLPPPSENADWPQPGGSPSKTGGHLALPDTLSQAWQVKIGRGSDATRRLNAAPVVFGGKVYTIDTEASVHAFDMATGRLVWESAVSVKGEDRRVAFGGGVSAGEGRVYATTGYGIVAAYDAATGKELWKVALGTPFRGAPTVANGRVYALTQDNQLYALTADKGATVWNVAGTVEIAGLLGTGAPAFSQDTLVVGYSSGELNALRAENGRTVWTDALARTGRTTALNALTDIDASPVIDRGRVFAIGHGGRMAAIELSTGQRVWERNFAGVDTPWVAGDFVYAVTLDGEVVCVTRGEGKIKWVQRLTRFTNVKKKTGTIEWSGPVLASDRLLLAGSNRLLVSMSPYTGKTLSSVKLSAAAYLPPIVAGKMVFLLTDDGKLTAYR